MQDKRKNVVAVISTDYALARAELRGIADGTLAKPHETAVIGLGSERNSRCGRFQNWVHVGQSGS